MDFIRAQEIFNSPETFEVLYNKTPIWIEELNPGQDTALVSSPVFDGGTKTVPVEQLVEGPGGH